MTTIGKVDDMDAQVWSSRGFWADNVPKDVLQCVVLEVCGPQWAGEAWIRLGCWFGRR